MTGEIDATGAIVAVYRDRLGDLRADADSLAWGGLRYDAALEVLGDDATPETIAALLEAARIHP